MIRAMMGRKKVEYMVYCNQGTPDVFVDGVMVGTVKDGVCKWTYEAYDKDVTVSLTGVTVPSTSTSVTSVYGHEVDGNYIGWQGQFPTFRGYKETRSYRFLSGNYRDTYRNTAVTTKKLPKGTATITMNYNSEKTKREPYNMDTVTYKDNGEQSSPGTWNGSVSISGDTVTVDYGTGGSWSVSVLINGKPQNLSMSFRAS